MAASDAVVANLTPFRGISADVGTAYEMGWAFARGLPVFAWSDDLRPICERVATARPGPDGGLIDDADWEVENFDRPDNLMLTEGLAAPIQSDLEAALKACAAWFQAKRGR